LTRANLVPPIATASGRTPQRPMNESTRQGASRQSRPWNPHAPGRRRIGRSRCNRDVATAHARHDRTPLERLVATTSPRGPRSTGVGRHSEGSPRLTASVSGPRSKDVNRSEQGSPATPDRRVRTRHPSAATEAATSRRHTRQRQPFDAREPPPQAISASEPEGPATSTTHLGCSGCTPKLQRVPAAAHRTSHVTTDPRPRGARTRCRHRIHATWFRRTSGCPPCRHGRRHTTHTARHHRGAPRHGALELRPKPQPSHVAPWSVRQRDSAQTRCS
jgi:hypothetical protein